MAANSWAHEAPELAILYPLNLFLHWLWLNLIS